MRARSMTIATARLAGLALLAALAACGDDPSAPHVAPPPAFPVSGTAVPAMASLDDTIPALMQAFGIPGGAVAVVRDGRLVYARGFGWADVAGARPVQPDALFRIASVSKPITAVAVLTLVEEGKLSLDDRVAPFLAHLAPAPGATVDPRWEAITIRHLLNHTGGWDRDRPGGGFDPMFRPAVAAAAVGAPAPASPETIIRYMKGVPLDFDPGARYAYSNFGYAILGRVIEQVSGMPYEAYVRARVLGRAGAARTRQGRTRLGDALAEEVRYYLPGEPGLGMAAPLVPSVFPGEGSVPVAYGGFYLESGDASGGWVSSTVDLLRFITAVDGRAGRPDIIGAATVATMTGSGPTVCASGACYYAAGWLVRPTQGDANWWHGGSLPGTTSLVVRLHDGTSFVALFNGRVAPDFDRALDAAMWAALGKVAAFPAHDLFATFR